MIRQHHQRLRGSNILNPAETTAEESNYHGGPTKATDYNNRKGRGGRKTIIPLTLALLGLLLVYFSSTSSSLKSPSTSLSTSSTSVTSTNNPQPKLQRTEREIIVDVPPEVTSEREKVVREPLPSLVEKVLPLPPIKETEGTLVKENCYFADGVTKFDSKDTPRAEVTVITGYFEMPNKHSSNEYDNWISNFMQIESFVIAFTNSDKTAEFLTNKRPEALRKQMVICKVTLEETVAFKKYGADGFQQQFAKDPERGIHRGYTLYLVWLGKIEFVLKGIELNPFGSDYFLWSDAGYFRDRSYTANLIKTWPDPERVRHVCGKGVAQLLMNPGMLDQYCGLGDFTTPEAFRQDKRLPLGQSPMIFTVAASPLCGSKDAFKPYADEFYRVMDIMYNAGAFIGKEQTIMAQMAVTRPDLVRLVQETTDVYREWFLFSHILRKEGTPGLNPKYTFESCLNRQSKQS